MREQPRVNKYYYIGANKMVLNDVFEEFDDFTREEAIELLRHRDFDIDQAAQNGDNYHLTGLGRFELTINFKVTYDYINRYCEQNNIDLDELPDFARKRLISELKAKTKENTKRNALGYPVQKLRQQINKGINKK